MMDEVHYVSRTEVTCLTGKMIVQQLYNIALAREFEELTKKFKPYNRNATYRLSIYVIDKRVLRLKCLPKSQGIYSQNILYPGDSLKIDGSVRLLMIEESTFKTT